MILHRFVFGHLETEIFSMWTLFYRLFGCS